MLSEFDIKQSTINKHKHGIDFPVWVVESLDKEARRLGITRQSLVKMWIADKFKK